jgi:ferredoxin
MDFPFIKEAISQLFSKPSCDMYVPDKTKEGAPNNRGRIVFHPDKCINCMMCERVCSGNAITHVIEKTPEGALKSRVAPLIDLYEKAVAYVNEANNQEVHDFLARRLYDMTCEIIMSLLIIDDASRAPELFEKSANVYVRMTEEDVCAKAYYIMHFTEADLASFRAE